MHRVNRELFPYNPEIEKTCRARNKIRTQKLKALKMTENVNENQNQEQNSRALRDFAIPTID